VRPLFAAILLLAPVFDCLAQPQFEAASIKPSAVARAGAEGGGREDISHSPVTLTMRNVRLIGCILWAYDLKLSQLSGPPAMLDERYDIQAKAASASTPPQLRLMMRALLADRFQLAMHSAQKEMAVYELVLGKNWKKPAESQPNLSSRLSIANGSFVFQHASMPWFAEKLSDFAGMDRPVVDRTGVTGDFDFTLKTAATVVLQRDIDALFSIVQEQLGLRIVPRRNTVEVWVVDRVERPTAN